MQIFIFASLMLIMLIVSLNAIRKPKVQPHIDLVLNREQEQRGFNVLPWVFALIVTIVVLRVMFGT